MHSIERPVCFFFVLFFKAELNASIEEYTERKKGLPQAEIEENKHRILGDLLTRMPQ